MGRQKIWKGLVHTRDQGKRERKIARRLTAAKVQSAAADKFSKDDTGVEQEGQGETKRQKKQSTST